MKKCSHFKCAMKSCTNEVERGSGGMELEASSLKLLATYVAETKQVALQNG